jgi:hypothetical protein
VEKNQVGRELTPDASMCAVTLLMAECLRPQQPGSPTLQVPSPKKLTETWSAVSSPKAVCKGGWTADPSLSSTVR